MKKKLILVVAGLLVIASVICGVGYFVFLKDSGGSLNSSTANRGALLRVVHALTVLGKSPAARAQPLLHNRMFPECIEFCTCAAKILACRNHRETAHCTGSYPQVSLLQSTRAHDQKRKSENTVL